ncbi:MAG: hypothetical protein LBB17_01850 [Puniceicoccales bacterium]|jgi:hypothetical protein|nr:hypothetical protein [Puniceicoccales bacterium]
MVGQIDEFKRIRARVKQAAIAENLKPTDVDSFDKDFKKFLDDPDVKDSLDSLEKTDEKLDDCLAQLAELETAEDGQTTPQTVGDGGAHGPIDTEYGANFPERHLPDEYATVEAQKDSIAHDAFKSATEIRRRSEEFAKNHPVWAKVGSVALQGAGYLGLYNCIKTSKIINSGKRWRNMPKAS